MRSRDEDPQLESQEQSTQELEENFLLMKMAAGPHTVRPVQVLPGIVIVPVKEGDPANSLSSR